MAADAPWRGESASSSAGADSPGTRSTATSLRGSKWTASASMPGSSPSGSTREVVTQDAYGRGPVRRSITSLRGAVRSGNSGGPMVDGRGRVVTTIFAATTSGPRGGYGVPNAVVRSALGDARGAVSTGPCA